MTQYSDEDVRAMAEDIIENGFEYVDECRRWGYVCVFCGEGPEHDPKDIKHEESCSYLVARKILGKDE